MNKTWYAVMINENDNDWGMGSYNKREAIARVKRDFPEEGWIAVIEEAIDEETGEVESTLMIDIITNEDIFNK